jgi:glycosyltransferase involved in cell wall biosynthesis
VGSVEGGPSLALPPGVAEEVGVGTVVEVAGDQRRVEPADQAGGPQPEAEVLVGVVVGGERRRWQADAEAVAPADREVAGPQDVEHVDVAAIERVQVRVVLGRVEAGGDTGAAPVTASAQAAVGGIEGDRHRADDDRAGPIAVGGDVAGDRAGGRQDVVVEQDDDVAGGDADAGGQGSELALVGYRDRVEPRSGDGEGLQDGHRPLVRAVDDDDELGGGRVVEDGVDEPSEAIGPADGGDDDGRAGPRVLFVAWGAVAGRSAELADAVGGQAVCFFPPGTRRPPVLVRWGLSAVATTVRIWRDRPDVVVVTNPPLVAALVAWAVGRAVRARVVLDSHPGGFGAQGDRVAARVQGLHRWLARRVDRSLVAAPVWADLVESWGGRALVVHEAPGSWQATPAVRHRRLQVLYVGRFAPDEPWLAVVEAAAAHPELDVLLTGDPGRAHLDPHELPGNVRLVGFLTADRYRAAVAAADVVVTLTTEPGSVMRAAYEAVWAGRPVVVSDWPVARSVFPFAVHVANDAAAIADGLGLLDREFDRLAADAAAARDRQAARWAEQRRDLRRQLGVDPAPG